jgi:hypothetical protein
MQYSIAEMRNPAEYRKPIACSMGLLGACYLTFSLVVYRYCGVWIASPALGSAGPLIKKISYGIALPGLWISATLCQHVSRTSRSIVFMLIIDIACRQVPLCQATQRYRTSSGSNKDTLGHLDRKHGRLRSLCLCHLWCRPILWQSYRSDRSYRLRSYGRTF